MKHYATNFYLQNIQNIIFVICLICFIAVDFTNILKQGFLDKIAQADGKERVKSVKEYYMDIYTPTSHYFTLNLESCIGTSVNTWNREALQRTVEGLMSFLLATSKSPVIRFDKSSPMAYRLAEEVDDRFKEANDAFSSGNSEPMTVLFVDRRNDLITPLLSHWTYQSMMHELLEFKNGLVAIHTIDANRHETRKEYSLMEEEDSFYKENIFALFGAFGESIRQYVEGYREKTNQHQALKEIKDMKKFINDYASYKKMGLVISKHVNIIDEITNQVSKRHLLQLSEIEQAIVSSEQKLHSDFRNVEKISEVIDMNLQLKLALLFYLKYRNHANFSEFSHEITRRILAIIPKDVFSSFLEYAEYEKSHSQSPSTSLKKSLLQKGKATISSLKGNNFPSSSTSLSSSSTSQQSNSIYTQHKPAIEKILNHLVSGKLSETQFPYFKSSNSNISTQSYLIFFVNGCTYEEVRIASLFSHVYCGSTQTCNFDSLLTDIKQLGTKK